MRWKQKPWPRYEQIRFHRKFLLLPKRLGMEWRWLEFATIRQIYGGCEIGWIDTHWFEPVPYPPDDHVSR